MSLLRKFIPDRRREMGEMETALITASKAGKLEKAKDCLKNAGDIKAEINRADVFGRTAISYAAEAHHIEVLNFLLENGADVNILDHLGRSPTSYAAGFQSKRRQKMSETEERKKHTKIMELLVDKYHAEFLTTSWGDWTPAEVAENMYNRRIYDFLLDHGAKRSNSDDTKQRLIHVRPSSLPHLAPVDAHSHHLSRMERASGDIFFEDPLLKLYILVREGSHSTFSQAFRQVMDDRERMYTETEYHALKKHGNYSVFRGKMPERDYEEYRSAISKDKAVHSQMLEHLALYAASQIKGRDDKEGKKVFEEIGLYIQKRVESERKHTKEGDKKIWTDMKARVFKELYKTLNTSSDSHWLENFFRSKW